MKTSLIVNPTITPPTGVLRIQALPKPDPEPEAHPLTDRFHAYACKVCGSASVGAEQFVKHVADAVAEDAPRLPAAAKHAIDPDLTSGQLRVFNAERDRLCRLLDKRAQRDELPTNLLVVVALLADMAEQAPAVDQAIREENERRARKLAEQPRLPNLLTKREPKP